MIIPQYNHRGQDVGFVNTENRFYQTTRDFKRNQIFIHPKYKHAVAIDREIFMNIVKIANGDLTNWKIRFVIINFEKEPFICEISLFNFRTKSESFTYDKRKEGINYTGYGEQMRLSIGEMTRVYMSHQEGYRQAEQFLTKEA